MKYRLKKDISLAKKGSIIYDYKHKIFPSDGYFTDCFVEGDSRYSQKSHLVYIGQFGDLIGNGWIEEIREPREWTLEVTKEQVYVRIEPVSQKLFSSGSEIIKVREVIE